LTNSVRRSSRKSSQFTSATRSGANVERDRVLDEDEIKELAKKLPTTNMAETGVLAVWIVLATCCRIVELLKARWDHVDLERKCWRIPAQNSKNNREHIVYLSSFAGCHFTKLKELTGAGEWCFPASRKSDCLCSKIVTKQITDLQRSNEGHKNRFLQRTLCEEIAGLTSK
jgi:integrase